MYQLPKPNPNPEPLNEEHYRLAASQLECEVAVIKAVTKVESGSSGFLKSGRPKILFEAHLFGRATKHRFDKDYPSISASKWDRTLYKGGEMEYGRLAVALRLAAPEALCSASWGRFQILGSNHSACGFAMVEEYVEANYQSEYSQLLAFASFIKKTGIVEELRKKDWAAFARRYNGPGFSRNRYDVKLAQAYLLCCIEARIRG